MITKTTSLFSFKSHRDRLFWYSRAGHLLFLIYFLYAAYVLITSQNTLVHWTISHFKPSGMPPFPIDSLPALGGLILNTISSLLLCWWYWMVARLFRKCEKGQVFSVTSFHLLKKIAKLFLFFAVVGLFSQLFVEMIFGPSLPGIPADELSEFIRAANVTHVRFGMFGLQFNELDLEPIAVALIIFIALGVIEEGRRIREEQQLTV